MLINAVPLGFIDFAIAVINAKSSKRIYLEELASFQNYCRFAPTTCHVTSSQHTISQSPLQFVCVEHEYN